MIRLHIQLTNCYNIYRKAVGPEPKACCSSAQNSRSIGGSDKTYSGQEPSTENSIVNAERKTKYFCILAKSPRTSSHMKYQQLTIKQPWSTRSMSIV